MKPSCLVPVIILIYLIACASESTKNTNAPKRNFELAVWAEFLPHQEYAKVYPELRELDVELFLAIRESDEILPDILKDMRFRAWLLLSKEKGYWLSTWNAHEFESFVLEVLQKNLNTDWIILDFEPPWKLTMKLAFSKSLTDFLSSLSQMKPPDSTYQEGKEKIDQMISLIHKRGKKVLCVFSSFVLDDLEDGDQDVSRFFGIYVPQKCDEYSFMLYTTILINQLVKFGLRVSSPQYFVYIYSKDAVRFFGEKSSVDLGLVGEDLFGNAGYGSPEELKRDISAGIAAGVRRFHVWALDNMRTDGRWDVRRWLNIGSPEPVVPPEDETISRTRAIIKALD